MFRRWSTTVAALTCRMLLALLPAGIRRRQGEVLRALVDRSFHEARSRGAVAFLKVWTLAMLDLLCCVAGRVSPIQDGLPRWTAFLALPDGGTARSRMERVAERRRHTAHRPRAARTGGEPARRP